MHRTYGNILQYAYITPCVCILMNDIALHCVLIIHVVSVQYSSGHEVEHDESCSYLLRWHWKIQVCTRTILCSCCALSVQRLKASRCSTVNTLSCFHHRNNTTQHNTQRRLRIRERHRHDWSLFHYFTAAFICTYAYNLLIVTFCFFVTSTFSSDAATW